MGFSRQENWSELPRPPPGDLPNPGIEAVSLMSPELAGGFRFKSYRRLVHAGGIGDGGLIPGLGRSPGGGNDNPLQYSCLKYPMHREAWWATVQKDCKEPHTTKHTTHHHVSDHNFSTSCSKQFKTIKQHLI